MESRIKIKIGQIEVDYEGSENFLKDEMLGFLRAVCELSDTSQLSGAPSFGETASAEQDNPNQESVITGTTNYIASRLKAKTGTDLVMAAAAHLTFVKRQDKFHRKDLLEEMKSASNYYKKSYSNNLTRNLGVLVKNNRLIEQSADTYAISADERIRLEAGLA